MQTKDKPDEGAAAKPTQDGKTMRRETQPTLVGAQDGPRRTSGVQRLMADGDGNCLPSPLVGQGVIAAGGLQQR